MFVTWTVITRSLALTGRPAQQAVRAVKTQYVTMTSVSTPCLRRAYTACTEDRDIRL